MSGSDDLERFFARLAGEAGTPVLDAGEARQVLDLTRAVAHEVERRLAPLTAYALGLTLDPAMPPAERAQRARALTDAVRRLAAEADASGSGGPGGQAGAGGPGGEAGASGEAGAGGQAPAAGTGPP